ncbi:DUF3558 domain-containing protein [Actinokineospora diospyrosa]|uniref:DUF3558 domain-containing protein n=1 Tax=Actinokineospora diospyrosa TaxID=103728 RepID=A0ABT1I907_9PSEU|nr:DUF3558 domain-containing protein [Actinokineospora diospyrosa]MCP2269077.1 Protein of unknown function (DUF3558) [Actinokineospora diospyrosa]
MRRSFWITSGISLVLLLTSCDNETAGTPTTPGDSGPPATTEKTSRTNAPTTPVADSIKPCELLSTADARGLGVVEEPRTKTTKDTNSCRWRVEKPVAADSYSIDITHYLDRGLKDLVSSETPTPVNVGSHEAVQAPGISAAGCVVALGLTAESRVDVYVTGGNQGRMCAPALDVAKIIDPKLP